MKTLIHRGPIPRGHVSCMSAKGCCWDKAVAESFISTLKHELGLDDDVAILNSPQQLIREMAFWIDDYYNRERRHSTIGYLSPIDYEQQFIYTRTISSVEPCHLPTELGQPQIYVRQGPKYLYLSRVRERLLRCRTQEFVS